MVEEKLLTKKKSHGKSSKSVKPSKYLDMVVDALQSLKDRKGSIPSNIVGYIANLNNLTSDKKVISGCVYRALKQGLETDLIRKNSYGHYSLAVKGKRSDKIPARRRGRRRKGRKGKKKRKGRRRKGRGRRRKGRKKGRKKGKRRRSRRRRSKRARRHGEEIEEPRRRGRPRKESGIN